MADSLENKETTALSGAGLLGVVTTGMYDNPLSMYREYIQNAADAVAGKEIPERARVGIAIDIARRRVSIRDNGPGLCPEMALERLLPIGLSDKRLGTDRGFRGIGRLAGLAFAKRVSFSTRACQNQEVTRITWHSDRLPEAATVKSDLNQAILSCVDVETLPGTDYPEHFFDVEVEDVALHSAGLLLNRDAVREYIGEVCPVGLSAEFPFADRVEGLFNHPEGPLTLEVLLGGDSEPIERPYGESIRFSANREAEFTELEVLRIPSVDGDGEAAVGWIAHTSYLGAIPKQQRVRGIRARVGNIQIGGEGVFDDLFREERLNRWSVGEIHILEPRIVPNARRDYFQPGPHLRNLENHLRPVLRKVAGRCRAASRARNRDQKTLSLIGKIEDTYKLAMSGYLAKDYAAVLVRSALEQIPSVREKALASPLGNRSVTRLDVVEARLNDYNGEPSCHPFGDTPAATVSAYQKMFQALAEVSLSPSAAQELMLAVILQAADTEKSGAGDE